MTASREELTRGERPAEATGSARRLRDEELLCCPPDAPGTTRCASRIAAEVGTGFDLLAGVEPAVSLFGSARIAANHPWYGLAREAGRRLGAAGFSIIRAAVPASWRRPTAARRKPAHLRSG